MFGHHKEVMTIEFGGETLVVPERDDPNPCTEDLIYTTGLFKPIKFPLGDAIRNRVAIVVSIIRNRIFHEDSKVNEPKNSPSLAIQGGSK